MADKHRDRLEKKIRQKMYAMVKKSGKGGGWWAFCSHHNTEIHLNVPGGMYGSHSNRPPMRCDFVLCLDNADKEYYPGLATRYNKSRGKGRK